MTAAPARRVDGRPVVIAVSLTVPGRVRVRLPVLRGAPALAHAVESRLAGHAAVHSVTTNALTGSVLVRFDPRRLDMRQLLATVGRETVAARAGRNGHRDGAEPAWHALGAKDVAVKYINERRISTAGQRTASAGASGSAAAGSEKTFASTLSRTPSTGK